MSEFDDIVRGIDINTEMADRMEALYLTGVRTFETIADTTREDPELLFMIVTAIWCCHFLGLEHVDQLLPQEDFMAVYRRLKEENA